MSFFNSWGEENSEKCVFVKVHLKLSPTDVCSSLLFPIQIMFSCPFISQNRWNFSRNFLYCFFSHILKERKLIRKIMWRWKSHETSNIGHKRREMWKKLCKYLLHLENMAKLKIAVRGQKSNNRVGKRERCEMLRIFSLFLSRRRLEMYCWQDTDLMFELRKGKFIFQIRLTSKNFSRSYQDKKLSSRQVFLVSAWFNHLLKGIKRKTKLISWCCFFFAFLWVFSPSKHCINVWIRRQFEFLSFLAFIYNDGSESAEQKWKCFRRKLNFPLFALLFNNEKLCWFLKFFMNALSNNTSHVAICRDFLKLNILFLRCRLSQKPTKFVACKNEDWRRTKFVLALIAYSLQFVFSLRHASFSSF